MTEERTFVAAADGYYFMPTATLSLEKALKLAPSCLIYDPMQVKTVADLAYLAQHEIDLSEEGQDGALSTPEIAEIRQFLQKLTGNTLRNPLLGKKIEAMIPAVKSDAAGSHHQEMTGDLPEHRVGAEEKRDNVAHPPKHACNPARKAIAGCSCYACFYVRQPVKTGAVDALRVIEARQPMQDDSGATTGLRRRPDYGESDSVMSTLNRENAKGASAQYVVALDAHNRKEASQKATMYVSSVSWADDCTKVAKFAYSPDPAKALKFGNLTAKAVMRQLNGPKFGVKSHIIPTTA